MRRQTRLFFAAIILIALVILQGTTIQPTFSQTAATRTNDTKLAGRWRVKFILSGVEKNLILDAQAKGAGTFLLLDTGPDNKPAAEPLLAVWSQLTNDRVSFSGEAELPMGTCCREIGTLIFKGRVGSDNNISGKFIFVSSVDEEENPYGFRSLIGTFTATRVPG